MSIVGRFKRLGITAKLIVPFFTIFGLAVVILGTVFVQTQTMAISRTLTKKAEILARNLATALGEPLFLGDRDLAQQLVEAASKVDEDVVYLIAVKPDGRAVATTDRALRDQTLSRSELEVSALKVTGFTRRDTATPGTFEVATPIYHQGVQVGVLRIGISTRNVEALARRAEWTILAVAAIGLCVGGLIYYYSARMVARPLLAAVSRLEDLARGHADLTVRLEVSTSDEVGQLGRALNTFLDKLHGLVGQIRETAFHVGGASQQLSAASEQLSGRAQEQASALEETAASLEQITGTIKQNADNARQANQLAVGSRDTAERGGQVVATAVAAMGEINRASKKIADIITTIDEIAFQTNLLALNAAVEAARAGEQGRGFAVVAAEVRNLAQRSATAAKEIKGLIQDSVGKVEAGSALVNQSGQTLEEIVTSVKRVTDIIAEISAASQEQSTGIDQVNRAVTQMDQVTQANAAQTEELSSTSQSLAAQSEQLQALVSRFKLGETAAPRAAAARPAAAERAPRPAAKRAPSRSAPEAAPKPRRGDKLAAPALATVGSGNGRGHDDGFEEF